MSEVTTRAVLPVVNALDQFELPTDHLFEDLRFDMDDLRDGLKQVYWDDAALLLSRVGPLMGRDALLEVGRDMVNQSLGRLVGALGANFVSAASIYRIGDWFGRMLFTVTTSSTELLDDQRIRQIVEITEPHRDSEEFFWIVQGALEAAPLLLGQSRSKIEAEIEPRRAEYYISPPPPLRLSEKLRRWSSTRESLEVVTQELQFLQERFELERMQRLGCEKRFKGERNKRIKLQFEMGRLDTEGRRS